MDFAEILNLDKCFLFIIIFLDKNLDTYLVMFFSQKKNLVIG